MLLPDLNAILTRDSLLLLASPLLALVYRVIKQFGIWAKLTGRDKALEGLKRLRRAAGYPTNFIQDNDEDSKIFEALLKRLAKHCEEPKSGPYLTMAVDPS